MINMKKIAIYILFFTIFANAQEKIQQADSIISYVKFDSVLTQYIKSYRKILDERKKIHLPLKDVYEKSGEYKIRVDEYKNGFYLNNDKKIKELNVANNRRYLVKIKTDSIKFNPDKEIVEIFHPVIKIPNRNYKPYVNCYVYPAMTFPYTWFAKKGFGIILNPFSLKREIARDTDIIKNTSELFIEFYIYTENNKPSLTINQILLTIEDVIIWKWKGKTSIPRINNIPLISIL